MSITIPKVWTSGEIITAADLNSVNAYLAGYFNTGLNLTASQIKDRYVLLSPWGGQLEGNIGATTREYPRLRTPVGMTLYPILAFASADEVTAGMLTLQVRNVTDSVDLLGSALTLTAVDTIAATTNFTAASLTGNKDLFWRLTGDATPWNGRYVSYGLWCKAVLTS